MNVLPHESNWTNVLVVTILTRQENPALTPTPTYVGDSQYVKFYGQRAGCTTASGRRVRLSIISLVQDLIQLKHQRRLLVHLRHLRYLGWELCEDFAAVLLIMNNIVTKHFNLPIA
jgi:hypothetical protein